MLERLGPLRALRRGFALARGRRWHVLGAVGAIIIASTIIQDVVFFVAGRLDQTHVGNLLSIAADTIANPFLVIVTTLVFVELRRRADLSRHVAQVFV